MLAALLQLYICSIVRRNLTLDSTRTLYRLTFKSFVAGGAKLLYNV